MDGTASSYPLPPSIPVERPLTSIRTLTSPRTSVSADGGPISSPTTLSGSWSCLETPQGSPMGPALSKAIPGGSSPPVTNALGQTNGFTYDFNGRQLSIIYHDKTADT